MTRFLFMKKILQIIFTRAAVLYIVIFAATMATVDFERINKGLKMRALNIMMPRNFSYIVVNVLRYFKGLGND